MSEANNFFQHNSNLKSELLLVLKSKLLRIDYQLREIILGRPFINVKFGDTLAFHDFYALSG